MITGLEQIAKNEWLCAQTEHEKQMGSLTTRFRVMRIGEEKEFNVLFDGDMLIDIPHADADNGVVLSVREQIALRDLLLSLHPLDVTAQKDY